MRGIVKDRFLFSNQETYSLGTLLTKTIQVSTHKIDFGAKNKKNSSGYLFIWWKVFGTCEIAAGKQR